MRQATWWSGRRCIPETINEPATDPRSGHAADQVAQQRAPTRYPEADAQLEANIAEYGVIQNLKGMPVARKKGAFEDEYVLPVLVLADARNAIEISLAENFIRLAMNLADACRAFQDVIETENKTPTDVSRRFGVTEKFVLGGLRLVCLAEPIFEALAAGDITLDVAIA
ncbi:ParB/RepB/Spo0J family partition protein [Novosphingobium sp. G106]|uniref:ParB/RepB/Spo0J family partition protein n=1 Tax=Novosphingobium sp. G106 TaxID=2849500 RepID=UPI001C2D87F7|nr:ParB/RepB/Spo0J family partition protein [Novosphingobium sp. G106]MBV1689866.1 ParB/RepB/Spo0J family partition protein [Novosphingobium sp. G106]